MVRAIMLLGRFVLLTLLFLGDWAWSQEVNRVGGETPNEAAERLDKNSEEIAKNYKETLKGVLDSAIRQHYLLIGLDFAYGFDLFRESIFSTLATIEDQREKFAELDLANAEGFDFSELVPQYSEAVFWLEAQYQTRQRLISLRESLRKLIPFYQKPCENLPREELENRFDPWVVAPPPQLKFDGPRPKYETPFIFMMAGSDEHAKEQVDNMEDEFTKGSYAAVYGVARGLGFGPSEASITASIVVSVFFFIFGPSSYFDWLEQKDMYNRVVGSMHRFMDAVKESMPSKSYSNQKVVEACPEILESESVQDLATQARALEGLVGEQITVAQQEYDLQLLRLQNFKDQMKKSLAEAGRAWIEAQSEALFYYISSMEEYQETRNQERSLISELRVSAINSRSEGLGDVEQLKTDFDHEWNIRRARFFLQASGRESSQFSRLKILLEKLEQKP